MRKEEMSDLLQVDAHTREEIGRIKALIPPYKSPAADRRANNALIREQLPSLTNDAVGYLAISLGHQLSLVELWRRLKGQQFQSLPELFRLADWLVSTTHTRITLKLLDAVKIEVSRVAPKAEPAEIIELVRVYFATVVCCRLHLERAMLSGRPDLPELLRQIGTIRHGQSDTSDIVSFYLPPPKPP